VARPQAGRSGGAGLSRPQVRRPLDPDREAIAAPDVPTPGERPARGGHRFGRSPAVCWLCRHVQDFRTAPAAHRPACRDRPATCTDPRASWAQPTRPHDRSPRS
jgi:hypothetical protein